MSHHGRDPLTIHATSSASPNWWRIRNLALHALHPHLPTGLPLYRRLQFGRFTPSSTILTNLYDEDSSDNGDDTTTRNGIGLRPQTEPNSAPWLIVFLDRSCRPETEAWTSASWENAASANAGENAAAETTLMRNFAQTVRDLGIPEAAHPPPKPGSAAPGRLDTEILFGAMHEQTWRVLQRAGLATAATATGQRHAFPFTLYVFDLKGSAEGEDSTTTTTTTTTVLPAGFRWGHLQDSHLELALSRQPYPRAKSTFAVLPNVAIFSEQSEDPSSWG